MSDSNVITGTLESEQIVRLDTPILLSAQRVRITLEPLLQEKRTGKTLIQWLKSARAELKAKGHLFRTKDEIDQYIREERESWGD